MSGEIDTTTGEPRKRRPIPIFEDRFSQYSQHGYERPYIDPNKSYLRKNILAQIGNNLNELVEIKTGGKSIDSTIEERNPIKIATKPVTEEKKIDIVTQKTDIVTTAQPSEFFFNPKVENKIDDKKDKKDDIKLGINNILPEEANKKVDEKSEKISEKEITEKVDEKISENKQVKVEAKLIESKKGKKVKHMNDEDPNMSPELRRSLRKAEMREMQEQDDISKKIRESAETITKNQREIENLKLKLDGNKSEIQKELNNKFGNLDNKFDNKFGNLDNKFDNKFSELGIKLKETCDGIDCLKGDIKKFELVECPDCGQSKVPPRSSFCPECGSKIHSWTEDDGTPLKNWKPNWQK